MSKSLLISLLVIFNATCSSMTPSKVIEITTLPPQNILTDSTIQGWLPAKSIYTEQIASAYGSTKKFDFIDGWEWSSTSNCDRFRIILSKDNQKSSLEIVNDYRDGWLDKKLDCIFNGLPRIHDVKILNSQYIEFNTSMGVVFFDRKNGIFLDYVMRSLDVLIDNFYTKENGVVVLKTQSVSDKISFLHPWYILESDGFNLTAPIVIK